MDTNTNTNTDQQPILAWHFVRHSRRLCYDMRHVTVHPGLVLEVDPDRLELCRYGLHASYNPLDALAFAPGAVVCRVRLSGRILRAPDKLCAERREVLWVADALPALVDFAAWCAHRAPQNGRVACLAARASARASARDATLSARAAFDAARVAAAAGAWTEHRTQSYKLHSMLLRIEPKDTP